MTTAKTSPGAISAELAFGAKAINNAARAALMKLATPASPADRPGDWFDRSIVERFGSEAVIDLVEAGLVQRGGTPDPLPPDIEVAYPDHMLRFSEMCQRAADAGKQVYPVGQDSLLVTRAGWAAVAHLWSECLFGEATEVTLKPTSGMTGTMSEHPDDRAIDEFARILKQKMADGRARGRAGWQTCPLTALEALLRESVPNGDPRDVANYAMMIWHNTTSYASPWKTDPATADYDFAEPAVGKGFTVDGDPLQQMIRFGTTCSMGGNTTEPSRE